MSEDIRDVASENQLRELFMWPKTLVVMTYGLRKRSNSSC